jgi:hypothetical protein
MDQSPLVSDQIEAGARFVAEFDKYATVQSAFWLLQNEGDWKLYIASDQITDHNLDLGYREVVRITQSMDDPFLGLFDVKLIGVDDPLAPAVMELKRRYRGRMVTLYQNRQIGRMEIVGLHIYATPIAVPSP